MSEATNTPKKRKTSLDYSVDRLLLLRGHAMSLLATTKRERITSKEYLSRRDELFKSKRYISAPLWVRREVSAYLEGGIAAYNLFDIVFVYDIDGKTYEVSSPEYKEVVDYSRVKEFEHTGRLVWKDDFSRPWFSSSSAA